MMIVCDKYHVISIDTSEGSETVTHDGEESDEDVVDHIDDVVFSASNIDPAN